jgi:hypothetical protein
MPDHFLDFINHLMITAKKQEGGIHDFCFSFDIPAKTLGRRPESFQYPPYMKLGFNLGKILDKMTINTMFDRLEL